MNPIQEEPKQETPNTMEAAVLGAAAHLEQDARLARTAMNELDLLFRDLCG